MSIFWLEIIVTLLVYTEAKTRNDKPNIVFILADDLGYADVSWTNPKISSPNLERLYNDSLKLKNYYVQAVCTPSRAAILTGYYPFHLGLQHGVIRPGEPSYLPLNIPTFPEKLKRLGYKTAAVGKWHLGSCDVRVTPTRRGFDSFYGLWLGAGDYYTHKRSPKPYSTGLDFRDDLKVVYDQQGTYSTYSFTQRSVKIINEHDRTVPLYLYLSHQNVHTPLQVPKKYLKMNKSRFTGKRRKIAAMVTAMDDSVGKVVEALEARGMMNNTIIVFSSDNGGPVQFASFNFPYRGSKGSLFEGGTKSAGFIYGNLLPKGEYQGLFHAVDWFPTLLKAAGYKKRLSKLDGIDQWHNLITNKNERNEIIYNIDEVKGRAAIRVGKYKLMFGTLTKYSGWYRNYNDVKKWEQKQGYEKGKSQCTGFPDPKLHEVLLFDLEVDPYEHNDISKKRPDLVKKLYAKLRKYKCSIVPAFTPDKVSCADPKFHNGTWSYGWCMASYKVRRRHC